jgi:hypothetical protein
VSDQTFKKQENFQIHSAPKNTKSNNTNAPAAISYAFVATGESTAINIIPQEKIFISCLEVQEDSPKLAIMERYWFGYNRMDQMRISYFDCSSLMQIYKYRRFTCIDPLTVKYHTNYC